MRYFGEVELRDISGAGMKPHKKQITGISPSVSTYFTEQSLLSTLDDSGIGVLVCDRHLRYKALNESAAEIHSMPIDAHLGHSLHHVLGGFADKVAPFWESVFATGHPVKNLEVTGRLPNRLNSSRWVNNFFPLKNRAGRVMHVGCFVNEVEQPSIYRTAISSSDDNDGSPIDCQRSNPDGSQNKPLSFREQQVLKLLAQGNCNKTISSILCISVRTVETYRTRMMLKIQATSIAHLIHYAIRNRIIEI
jgi:DNA-binding CsgD family transcriptional regulator